MQKTIVAIAVCLVLLLAFTLRSRGPDADSSGLAGIDFHQMDPTPARTAEPEVEAPSPVLPASESNPEASLEKNLDQELDLLSLAGDLTDVEANSAEPDCEDCKSPSTSNAALEAPAVPSEANRGNTSGTNITGNQAYSALQTVRNPYFKNDTVNVEQTVTPFSANPKFGETEPSTNDNAAQKPTTRSVSPDSIVLPPANQNTRNEIAHDSQPVRSPAVQPASSPEFAARAMRHVEQGNTMARRGATATAHGEFIQALVAIADGRDSVSTRNTHNVALKTAIQILDEVRDFYTDNTTGSSVADSSFVVGTHICGVVSAEQARSLTKTEIRERYLSGIRDNFYAACGEDKIAASALSSLGKLHSIKLNESGSPQECEWNIAMTLLSTALRCDHQDARSANEMGVLLVKVGDYPQAKQMFQISLRIQPNVATWRNLAWLHTKLGELELAALAEQEAGLVASAASANGVGLVQWIDPQSFGARPEEFDPVSSAATPPQSEGVRSAGVEKKSIFSNPFAR